MGLKVQVEELDLEKRQRHQSQKGSVYAIDLGRWASVLVATLV